MRTDRSHSHYAPSPQLVSRLLAGAPAWGRRIAKFLSPEGVLGTRFPGRRVLVAKYVQPRGPRHGEFPAASAGGRRFVKSLSPEEGRSLPRQRRGTRFCLRGYLQ